MKTINNNKGFGLIEVIVGVTMLLITSIAALSLSQTVIRTESFNEKRVIGYNLAQQVMEETRRSRDSSWDDLKSDTRWGDGSIDESDVLLGEQTGNSYECSIVSDNEIGCKVENEDFVVTREIQEVNNFSNLHGITTDLRGSDIDDSLVRRVIVKVTWTERGAERDITLVTLLTDWKAY